MMKPPKIIWLQINPGENEMDDWEGDPDEITWCVDKINESDVRYIIDKRHLKRT